MGEAREVELGDVYQPTDPRRRTWEGEVVAIKGRARLGPRRRAILRCSDGRSRELTLESLLRPGCRGFVRLPPRRPPAPSPTPALGLGEMIHQLAEQQALPAAAPGERHRFTTRGQIVGGDRSCRVWRCAGCQVEQVGLQGWQQVIFSAAPSERFITHLRDQEHTIVCSRPCAAEAERRWAQRLAPQALAAARTESVLGLLTRPLDGLAEAEWGEVVTLALGLRIDNRRTLTQLGARVLELHLARRH